MGKPAGIFFIFAIIVGCLALPAMADEITELKEQVEALRQENRLLQGKLKSQEGLIQDLGSRLEKIETKEIAQPAPEKELIPSLTIPKMQVKGFADVSFKAEKAKNRSAGNPSTFSVGEFDFMVTSRLSDKIDFFSENVIEVGDAQTELDIERIYLKYGLSELFNILVGRIHTPLGFWNTTYHHGTWFQTSATRPLLMEFEHDNGPLPLHLVGVNFQGMKDFELLDFEYNIGIFNGRHANRTKVQNVQDGNDNKAFNSLLTFKPSNIPGLSFGFNTYVDKIPALSGTAAREGEINELVLGGYFAYLKDNLEVLFEGFRISHDDEVSEKKYKTNGFYFQTGYKLKEKYTPYYRFDFLHFGQGDPFYSGIDADSRKHSLGLRWDIATWNALKVEYSYNERRDASDNHSITINDSFHF